MFWPLAIDRTRLDITWFASDWGEGEMPPDLAQIWQHRLTRLDTVMDEDYENLEPIQRSMESAAHGGQAINYQERRIWHVQAWIDKVIGPDGFQQIYGWPICSLNGLNRSDLLLSVGTVRCEALPKDRQVFWSDPPDDTLWHDAQDRTADLLEPAVDLAL